MCRAVCSRSTSAPAAPSTPPGPPPRSGGPPAVRRPAPAPGPACASVRGRTRWAGPGPTGGCAPGSARRRAAPAHGATSPTAIRFNWLSRYRAMQCSTVRWLRAVRQYRFTLSGWFMEGRPTRSSSMARRASSSTAASAQALAAPRPGSRHSSAGVAANSPRRPPKRPIRRRPSSTAFSPGVPVRRATANSSESCSEAAPWRNRRSLGRSWSGMLSDSFMRRL